MDELTRQLSNLAPFKLEQSIIRQVVAQLDKDLNDLRLEVEFTGKGTPYDELSAQLKPIIAWLLEKYPEKLFALFYRIDIPEGRVRQLLLHAEDPVQAYTDLILDRELQKVIIRNFYSASQG